jgi:small subunit ribosomal protein S16
MGATKQPSYRVVVADSASPRDGRFIEIIGHYNPLTKPPTVNIDVDKAQHWLGVGAEPTESAARLLRKAGMNVGTTHTKPASELPSQGEAEASNE